jgi:dUTPase
MRMQALPTGIYGLLLSGTAGLLLGRSSATMAGLMIAPGVIDADYTGEIKIMTSSPTHISVIQPGQKIAQLLLIPLVMTKNKVKTNI